MSFFGDIENTFSSSINNFTSAWGKVFSNPGKLNLGDVVSLSGIGAPIKTFFNDPLNTFKTAAVLGGGTAVLGTIGSAIVAKGTAAVGTAAAVKTLVPTGAPTKSPIATNSGGTSLDLLPAAGQPGSTTYIPTPNFASPPPEDVSSIGQNIVGAFNSGTAAVGTLKNYADQAGGLLGGLNNLKDNLQSGFGILPSLKNAFGIGQPQSTLAAPSPYIGGGMVVTPNSNTQGANPTKIIAIAGIGSLIIYLAWKRKWV